MCYHLFALVTPTFGYVTTVCFGLVGFIAAIGNTLSMIVIVPLSKKSKSNKILLSLVVSDCGVTFVVIPLIIWLLNNGGRMDTDVCTVESVLAVANFTMVGSSLWSVAFIAFDRYLVLTKYSVYDHILTERRLYTVIVAKWMTMFTVSFVVCVFETSAFIILIVINFFGPITLNIACYFMIWRAVRESRRRLNELNMDTQIQQRRQIKLAKKVTRLITVVLVCLLPDFLWQIVSLFVQGKVSAETNTQISVITYLGVISNSCVNPFIYMSFAEFKMKLKKTLRYDTKQARTQPSLEPDGIRHPMDIDRQNATAKL